MKKVWILERFATREDLEQNIRDLQGMNPDNEEGRKCKEDLIAFYEDQIRENPNGYWYGIQGKVIYKQFCECAKESMRGNTKVKYRVVKAEIEDNAKYWAGYKNPVENEGVLRYLYATR